MNEYLNSKSVVAFIDILGFKEIVDGVEKDEESQVLDKLKEALYEAREKAFEIQEPMLVKIANE